MIDLTRITPEQANKIECALLQMEHIFEANIETYTSLAEDDALKSARATFKSNAEWWKEVRTLIYGE